jgi:hypothetical protein
MGGKDSEEKPGDGKQTSFSKSGWCKQSKLDDYGSGGDSAGLSYSSD